MLKQASILPTRLYPLIGIVAAAFVAGCAASTPRLPYPAFVETGELPDVFMASLPGVRAKAFSENAAERTGRYRVDLPADWTGTSGGVAQAALEIFVIAGQLTVGDIKLVSGGYAYLPSGSLGFRLASPQGARILYMIGAEDPSSVIRGAMINDGTNPEWTEEQPGVKSRILREDPGSGAKTWLVRVSPEAEHEWRLSLVAREGYLVSGAMTVSECFQGKERSGTYLPGGYFLRPANTVFGGGETAALRDTTWFLREVSVGGEVPVDTCESR